MDEVGKQIAFSTIGLSLRLADLPDGRHTVVAAI
jgi:hypothetical protein